MTCANLFHVVLLYMIVLRDVFVSSFMVMAQVILHVAATIRFTEKIKLATKMNIQSVQSILALGRDLKECAAIVHTSTAYAHTYQSECPETFLEPS